MERCRLWNAVPLFAYDHKRCLPRSSCVIRCLPYTLLTCRNVPSAFLCRVKGHTLTLCARRRGSLGTRLGRFYETESGLVSLQNSRNCKPQQCIGEIFNAIHDTPFPSFITLNHGIVINKNDSNCFGSCCRH